MYADVLNSILEMLHGYRVEIGAMPANNGIAMYIGSGAPGTIFFDKGSNNQLSLVVNAKNSNQLIALKNLSDIHYALSMKKDYPEGVGYEILDISTSTAPNYIGREENNQYLYGSILRVQIFIKGDEC